MFYGGSRKDDSDGVVIRLVVNLYTLNFNEPAKTFMPTIYLYKM